MTPLIVESTRDPGLYAELSLTGDGEVLVRICRRSGWRQTRRGAHGHHVERLLGQATIDAPLHLVTDRVHDFVNSMSGGEKR
jgi:hypothetical protein